MLLVTLLDIRLGNLDFANDFFILEFQKPSRHQEDLGLVFEILRPGKSYQLRLITEQQPVYVGLGCCRENIARLLPEAPPLFEISDAVFLSVDR